MTRPDADRLFTDFAQRGNAAALARVFDLLAGELLLLAAHVAPRGADPEDLLQDTFLCAIEHRAKFDPTRPVRPWLVGILGNLAREARRRLARAPDPQRLRVPADVEPIADAQTHELEGTLAETLHALPRLDRQVLTLRLVHGLTDAQIAQALAVPLPTAKARLRRGLARLREGLPASLAGGLAAFDTRERGLGAVRAEVLAAAAAVAPATTAGIGAMVKLAALVALLLGSGIAFAWPGGVPADEVAPPAAASVYEVRQPSEPALRAAASPRQQPPSRTAIEVASAALRGRCVARESGEPLAGCEVEVKPQYPLGGSADVIAAWQRVAKRSASVTSAADGTFALDPPPDTDRFILVLTFRARDRMDVHWALPHGTRARDLGDIELGRPVPVSIAIVDTRGDPVAGAEVSLASRPVGDAPCDLLPKGPPATDARGRAVVEPGVGAGVWLLQVRGHPLITPTAIAVEDDAPRQEVEIVVLRRAAGERLAGVVLDAEGAPLSGVWVSLDGESSASTTTPRGAFQIVRTNGPASPGTLRLRDFEGRAAPTTIQGPFEWGRTDLELTMLPAVSVRVLVSDAETGQAIANFSVQRTPAQTQARFAVQRPRPAEAVVPAVEWGVTALRILPEDTEYEPSELLVLERGSVVDGKLAVRLQRRGEVRVRVRRADGTPVAGSTVEVLADPGGHLSAHSLTVAQLAAIPMPALFAPQLDSARSDADGIAVVRVAPAPRGRALRVRGAHPDVVLRDVVLQPGAVIEVTVRPAASVRGRVGPADLLRELRSATVPLGGNDPFGALTQLGVIIAPAHGSAAMWPTPFDAEGRFEVRGLPVGRCVVTLNNYVRYEGGGGTQRTRLATVDLQAGEQDLEIDLGPARPATLHATVVAGGRPCVAAQVMVAGLPAPDGPDFHSPAFTTYCDARGGLVLPGLPAATYRIYLEHRDRETGTSHWVPSAETCEVQPGATVHARFTAERRRVRVRVLDTDGRTPVAHAAFLFTPGLDRNPHHTDADGWLTLDPAPAGAFHLRVALAQGPAWSPSGALLGPLELPPGEEAGSLTVTLR